MKRSSVNIRLLAALLLGLALFMFVSTWTCWEDSGPLGTQYAIVRRDTFYRFERCRRNPDAQILLLGASATSQVLTPFFFDSKDVVCCLYNADVTVVGYYFFCAEYFKSHLRSGSVNRQVYLVADPWLLLTPFVCPHTMPCCLVPWKELGYWEQLDEGTASSLREFYGVLCQGKWPVRLMDRLPLWRRFYWSYLDSQGLLYQESGHGLAHYWLERLDSLCRENQASLQLICMPLAEEEASRTALKDVASLLKGSPCLEELNRQFQASARFMPRELFTEEGRHFKPEYAVPANMYPLAQSICQGTELARYLPALREAAK